MTVLAAALFVVLQNPIQQTAPQQTQPAKSSIEGYVLRAGTNEPIGRARVTVTRSQVSGGVITPLTTSTSIPPVTTDNQGHFVLRNLDPGPYTLVVQRNGFARQAYGERAPGRGGTPLNLAVGQAMKDVVMRLIPAGTVTGRVSDATGEPISSINVQLLRSTYDGTGQRRFQTAGSARTNDRGEYRIYWVTPGRYFVNAAPNRSPIDSLPIAPAGNEVTDPGYVVTYYPGTVDPSTAAAIEVQPGVEISAIDFTLTQQQLFRIRGRVFDPKIGQFPRNASILVLPRDPAASGVGPSMLLGINSYNSNNGTFEVRDVAPGSYWVRADAPINAANPDFNQRNTGQVAVDVSKDVDDLVIAFTPGFSLPGRLSLEGGTAVSSLPDFDRMRILLAPTVPSLVSSSPSPVVSNDGSFKLDNVQPGDYRVSIFPMPPGMYIKEARIGRTDVLNSVSVTGPLNGSLDILLSPNSGQVDGAVIDKDRHPVPGIQVVLIPDRQRDRRDLYKTATSDQNGHFTIRSIVPGDYKLFAWEDLEPFAYNDPDILRKYEEKGTLVKVSESSKLNIEAKVIPAGE
jgi:sarcosine oxidase gamma subunit